MTSTPAATTTPSAPATFDPELRRIAIVVVLGAIMTILDTTIVNVAIETLGRELHTSLSTIQWVLTGYTLALSLTIPISGWAVERFGGKTMWLVSLTLFIAGSVLCGAAWSPASLITFRVLQGAGGGMLAPVGQTMLARAAGPERMGRVMSVISVPVMLAPVLGPLVGGVIVDHLAWRWMFYVNVPVCGLALLLAIRLLPPDTERRPSSPLDVRGLVLLSPGLALLVYGLSVAGNGAGLTSVRFLTGVVLGAVLTAMFVVHAIRRAETALLDLRLFRHRSFCAAAGGLFLYGAAVFGVMILLPLYSQVVRGESPLDAGALLAPLGVGAMVTMVVSGRIADRYGSREVTAAGLVVAVAGIVVCTQIAADTNKALLLAVVFVIGLGHGLVLPPAMAALYRGLPRSAVPSATTAGSIVVRVASAAGVAVLAVVLQIYIRAGVPGAGGDIADVAARAPAATEIIAHAFGRSFWWAVGIGAAALIPVLAIPGRRSAKATAGTC